MRLENGYELEGNISNSMININNTWTKILIIETTLEKEKLRELFKNNSIITETIEAQEIIYYTDGLIDIKEDNNKSYVWLYFKNSTSRELIKETKENVEKLNKQLLETQNLVLELQYKLTNKDLEIK